jgi:hypothetical protein
MLIIIQNLRSLLDLWDSVVETDMLQHSQEQALRPVPQKFNVLVERAGEPVYILKFNVPVEWAGEIVYIIKTNSQA